MEQDQIKVSAPGRICLFGEHQDYFGLPIIAAAINLRITVSGERRKSGQLLIRMPDINREETLSLGEELKYSQDRDYLRSAVNILRRQGKIPGPGWDCIIEGTIPINSGTASSSALVVAWIKFLLESAQDRRTESPEEIAELAFLAEVAEFDEPGGKMDHYSSSLGGVVCLHFGEHMDVWKFPNSLGRFVLADSLQRKDTKGTLGHIKSNVLRGMQKIRETRKEFDVKESRLEDYEKEIRTLNSVEQSLLKGTLRTRDLTAEGETLFLSESFDHIRFGELLCRQQDVLRNDLKISTPKFDRMLDAALQAGALGAKGNGSGGGGCIFAYAPDHAEEVAEALRREEAQPYIISIDHGARREPAENQENK